MRKYLHTFWFHRSWWKYLLEKPKGRAIGWCGWWTRFWCRARGHDDVWWYNVSGDEPDMHCKTCMDDLG